MGHKPFCQTQKGFLFTKGPKLSWSANGPERANDVKGRWQHMNLGQDFGGNHVVRIQKAIHLARNFGGS